MVYLYYSGGFVVLMRGGHRCVYEKERTDDTSVKGAEPSINWVEIRAPDLLFVRWHDSLMRVFVGQYIRLILFKTRH
jgi:hypothetical protein